MRRGLRENAVCALAAGAASAAVGWLGLYGFAWNDYEVEAKPALDALVHGHLRDFLALAPAYGGSLVERAPFALAPGLWGGGALAVYRALALPCLLAAAVLGVWLCARMRAAGRPALARGLALLVCVINPLTLRALEVGHPEELLGGCLCVAAVVLAARGRAPWAGVALGLAVANKEWALLAAGPVLLALPPSAPGPKGHRWRGPALCVGWATGIAGAVLAPLALAAPGGFSSSARGAAVAGSGIFQPWQLWWFAGAHAGPVHGLFGAPKPGYRTGPAWASAVSHPLIVLVGVAVAGGLWLARRRRVDGGPGGVGTREREALLALALALLLRCVLDTWDTAYYAIPFVLALVSWEALGVGARLPLLAAASSVLAWGTYEWLPARGVAPDGQALAFLAWTLPLAEVLALRLFAPGRWARVQGRARAQSRTVSSVGSPVMTRQPVSVMSASSSMRTPHRSGT